MCAYRCARARVCVCVKVSHICLLQTRHQFQNEYQVLCQLPPHDNLIHMWAFFFDRADPAVSSYFNRVGKNVRTMSLFILMDEHLQNMKELLETLVDLQGPKVVQ